MWSNALIWRKRMDHLIFNFIENNINILFFSSLIALGFSFGIFIMMPFFNTKLLKIIQNFLLLFVCFVTILNTSNFFNISGKLSDIELTLLNYSTTCKRIKK